MARIGPVRPGQGARRMSQPRRAMIGRGVKGYGPSAGYGSYVTQHLMLPGSWSLRLRRDTPQYIRRDLVPSKNPTTTAQCKSLFSHIVITPGTYDIDAIGEDLLDQALYTGVIVRAFAEFDGSVELSGHDPSWWLGDANGIGDNITTPGVTKSSGTLSAWITDLLPTAIASGTVTNTGTSFAGTIRWQTEREAIDAICRRVGAEWRVNPDFTLDAAVPTTLYSSTPTTFFAPRMRGADWTQSLRGFDAVFPRIGFDGSRYTSHATVVGPGAGTDIISQTDFTTSLVLNPRTGATSTRRLIVDGPDLDRTELSGIAAKIREDWAEPISSYTITTTGNDKLIRSHVGPGNYTWVHWPGVIEDTDNTVDFMGDTYPARKMRVWSMGWPIEAGMGVYYRRTDSGGTPEWVDLSQWVEWSAAAPVLTVGFRRRPPVESTDRLGVRLADHQEINRRANDTQAQRQQIIYTPGGNVDATTGGTFADWFTIGSVSWPAWAARAEVDVTIPGIRDITAANNDYDLRLVLGSTNGQTEIASGKGTGIRFTERLEYAFTGTPPVGSQTLKVQAKRTAGTGQFRIGTACNVTANVRFYTA